MTYFMGIDISTTSAKALVIDERGKVVSIGSTPQPISQPQPLWSEQDPDDWWDGVVSSIRAALSEANIRGDAIKGIGLTGQMHGLCMLDQTGSVLRPAILWNDQRTQTQCDEITEMIGFERLIALTGNRALTGFTAPKLMWVKAHEPEVYQRCAHVLLPKDFLRYKLTGEYATDLADASGTLLVNVARREWSQEMLDALAIPHEWMPLLYEGTQITSVISSEAAALSGLTAGTPVVAGGGDQAAGAVGMGCVSPDKIGVTVGTSGVVFAPRSQYVYEPEGRLHAFCHAVPGQWHFMGVMLSAAGSLQWFRDTLTVDVAFGQLLSEAASVPAGCDGLLFLPYLTGERTPHPDPNARGAFVGLTSRHTRGHLTRAVLEGVAFGLKDSFALIANAGLPNDYEVRISGGGARSPVWQQIIADILGAPLINVNTPEAGAFGAALLASVGTGAFSDVESASHEWIATGEAVFPGEQSERYGELHDRYQALYPALKPFFDA